jgi:hypothetical protein
VKGYTAMRLFEKLTRLGNNPDSKGFAICDARDCDMGGGITAFGPVRDAKGRETGRHKSRADFLQAIREIVQQDIIDMMLLSVSNLERAVAEGLFKESAITLAARANDTTDIWMGVRGGGYTRHPPRPFRTPAVEHILSGSLDPASSRQLTDLALYSVTFVNDNHRDFATLAAYREFRLEAERRGLRYFLEVFNPDVGFDETDRADVGRYANDCIVSAHADVAEAGRPQFLKVAFNGPAVLEELVSYDSRLIVGVLGGNAGAARDAMELLRAAQRSGARLALFGRKIRLAESPLSIIELMRRVLDEEVSPTEAVKVYHDRLKKAEIQPVPPFEKDVEATDSVLKACASAA